MQARSFADGFRLYREQHPDAIIVNLTIGTGAFAGLSLIRRVRFRDWNTPILVLTMLSDPVIVSRAREVGASGYVLKDTCADEVLEAFRIVCEGGRYLNHDLALELAFMHASRTTNPLATEPIVIAPKSYQKFREP